MEEKKGKKECQRPIFQASFRLKEKRTLWRPRRRRVVSPPPQPSSCRRLTVSIFLIFVFFLFTISARQLYTPPLPPRTLSLRTSTTPTCSITISSPPFCPAPLRGAYCCTVYCGNNANGDCGTTGGSGGDSFLKVSFWFWRWQIHTILSSVVFRRPRTHIHIHTRAHTNTVPLLPQSLRTLCVCVRMRRTTLFHLS